MTVNNRAAVIHVNVCLSVILAPSILIAFCQQWCHCNLLCLKHYWCVNCSGLNITLLHNRMTCLVSWVVIAKGLNKASCSVCCFSGVRLMSVTESATLQCMCTTPCSVCVLLGSLVHKATNLNWVDALSLGFNCIECP